MTHNWDLQVSIHLINIYLLYNYNVSFLNPLLPYHNVDDTGKKGKMETGLIYLWYQQKVTTEVTDTWFCIYLYGKSVSLIMLKALGQIFILNLCFPGIKDSAWYIASIQKIPKWSTVIYISPIHSLRNRT